jgi:hypothetical protein
VNGTVLAPGDSVLFRAGTRYGGQLRPRGSGRKGRPIAIGSYGRGPRPRIDGNGEALHALYLHNVEYYEVSGLEISNMARRRQPHRTGVCIHLEDFGTAHHIVLRDIHVHDVNGSVRKAVGGGYGILWHNEGDRTASRFDGLLIEDCHLERTDRNGICGLSAYWPRDRWHPSLNVVIRGNLLEDIGGDGIVPIGCEGALVEHNTLHRGGHRLLPGDAAAGVWPWSCDGTTIQHNEVSHQSTPWDGQGFDSDWNCRNTVIQYNYSHDNQGGFLLVCDCGEVTMPTSVGNAGTVVRYNISVNDGCRATGAHAGFSPTFHLSGPLKDTLIYNNVIYVGRKPTDSIDTTLVKMDNWGGPWPVNTRFHNNILFAEDKVDYEWGEDQGTVFSHNAFVGEHADAPADPNAITDDPMLVCPGSGGDGFDSIEGYRLRPGSPCRGRGLTIPGNGGRDVWGNRVREGGPVDIGAHQTRARPRRR